MSGKSVNVGLIAVTDKHDSYSTWVLAGTEVWDRYENHYQTLRGRGYVGVPTFGTIKVRGHESEICYRIGSGHAPDAIRAGWKEVGRGTHYTYVTRGDLKGDHYK